MNRIRLLCLLPSLKGGGAERVMTYLVRGLPRERFDVTLGLGKREGPYLPMIPDDIRTIEFQVPTASRAIIKLSALMAQERFDACFSMLAMNLAAVLARRLARARLRLVLGARNHYSLALPAEARFAFAKRWAVRMLYPKAEMVIAVSQGVCDDLVSHFGLARERMIAIPNPIELDAIRAAAAVAAPHRWLERPRSHATLVAVGKLQEAKGHRFLIEACKRLRTRADVRLLIAGRGPLESKLQELIHAMRLSDAVELVGFQQNPHAFIAHADVFVLPSLWEGFPNVLTEAMACGTAVVSTNCPSGPSEILEHGVNGLLVEVGNVEALAKAIGSLVEDPLRRQALVLRANNDVVKYDAPRIIGLYADALERIVRDTAG